MDLVFTVMHGAEGSYSSVASQAAAMHEVRVSSDNSSEAVSEAQGAHMVERVDHMEVMPSQFAHFPKRWAHTSLVP